jgi:hypothetical protein
MVFGTSIPANGALMATQAQTVAQISLMTLETNFLNFCEEEQNEIANVRVILRELIAKYRSSAELAIIAAGFEIAIKEKQ